MHKYTQSQRERKGEERHRGIQRGIENKLSEERERQRETERDRDRDRDRDRHTERQREKMHRAHTKDVLQPSSLNSTTLQIRTTTSNPTSTKFTNIFTQMSINKTYLS